MEAEITVKEVRTFDTKGGNTRYVLSDNDGNLPSPTRTTDSESQSNPIPISVLREEERRGLERMVITHERRTELVPDPIRFRHWCPLGADGRGGCTA